MNSSISLRIPTFREQDGVVGGDIKCESYLNTSMSVYFFPRTGGKLIEYLFVNIIIVFGYLVAYKIQFIVESAFYSVWFGIQGKGP